MLSELEVECIGSGPKVVLVHGSVVDGQRTWAHQRELAERWTLWIANRPGFGHSPELELGGDFELEAPMFAALLGDGAHLAGHSFGGVIALLAAASAPDAVKSLTVSEPGLLRVAAGNPRIDELIQQGEQLYAAGRTLPPQQFLRMFRAGLHSSHITPDELPDWLENGARLLSRERPPWHADVPLDDLAAAGFPKLVISGGHSPEWELVCDTLAERIGAERAVIEGRMHTIPSVGVAYNERVEEFWLRAEAGR
jgi:pimeloyl-ACP methyl ester carboxylesterase